MNILCYGDSNTWGVNPNTGGRWPRSVRWTGRLAELLGPEHYVIEEGLCGRTTVFDDVFTDGRNGLKALPNTLETHAPLDLVIIALGVNDCAVTRSATPRVSAHGIQCLINVIYTAQYRVGNIPKVLVMSPAPTSPNIAQSNTFRAFDETSYEKSCQLAPLYKDIAQQNSALFFDAATVSKSSETDYLHMEEESHEAIAQALYGVIKEAFSL